METTKELRERMRSEALANGRPALLVDNDIVVALLDTIASLEAKVAEQAEWRILYDTEVDRVNELKERIREQAQRIEALEEALHCCCYVTPCGAACQAHMVEPRKDCNCDRLLATTETP